MGQLLRPANRSSKIIVTQTLFIGQNHHIERLYTSSKMSLASPVYNIKDKTRTRWSCSGHLQQWAVSQNWDKIRGGIAVQYCENWKWHWTCAPTTALFHMSSMASPIDWPRCQYVQCSSNSKFICLGEHLSLCQSEIPAQMRGTAEDGAYPHRHGMWASTSVHFSRHQNDSHSSKLLP